MSDVPADLRYSNDHLWARADGGGSTVHVGITDYAQQALGDIIAVTLPGVGDNVQATSACGDIESTKNLSDLVSPVTGTVSARNDKVEQNPEVINTSPYDQGWLFDVDVSPSNQLDGLMDAQAYRHLVGD